MEVYEILDRFEILNPDVEYFENLRRSYVDRDLSSIFKISGTHANLRRAVEFKNPHSLFRMLEEKYGADPKLEDLKKVMLGSNLHSLFRLLEECEFKIDIDEFRKAVLEKNLHSVFRLIENQSLKDNIEDLRKAVVEENIHSIWRIIFMNIKTKTFLEGLITDLKNIMINQNMISLFNLLPSELEDYRKAILDDNLDATLNIIDHADIRKLLYADEKFAMFRLLEERTQSRLLYSLKDFHRLDIKFDKDCLSRGQIKSKMWLIHELKKLNKDLGIVFLCAGWYATLSAMMFEAGLKIQKIRSFDIDPDVWEIAETFNKPWMTEDWKFKASTKDIYDIDFEGCIYDVYKRDGSVQPLIDVPDTVINTSCEHIKSFAEWFGRIPEGKLCIMQANNFEEIEEHINVYNNLDDFSKDCPMQEVLFEGKLPLDEYTRFMKIGIR